MTSQVGTLLSGRYRLDAQIGAGGMSTVYRAFDTVLERQVAIKLMHREIAADADQLERFRREARAVAQLNHPHIVGVIDAGRGARRADRRRPRRRTSSSSTSRARRSRTASGASAGCRSPRPSPTRSRSRGRSRPRTTARIVHRDVKPQNVLIDDEGTARGHRLRDRALADRGGPDGRRPRARHDRLRLARAGARPRRRPAVRPLLARHRPLRDAHRRRPVPRREPGRRRDEARPRGRSPTSRCAGRRSRARSPPSSTARPRRTSTQRYQDDARADRRPRGRAGASRPRARRPGDRRGDGRAAHAAAPAAPARAAGASCIPRASSPLLALAGAIAAVVLVVMATDKRAERGTGTRNVKPPPGLQSVSLGQSRAKDFDPFGGDGEHPAEAKAVVDQDTNSTWSTESYDGGVINNKPGVGIYVDAKPGVAAKAIDVISPTPRLAAARSTPPPNGPPPTRAQRLARSSRRSRRARRRTRVKLAGRQALPLLPGVDHEAAAGRLRRSRSPRSALFRLGTA